VLGGGLALAFADDRQGAGIQPSSGFDHGRLDQWRAAVEVGADEPLKGVGAEAYFLASRDEQGGHAVLYAHNVVLEAFAELGVVGLVLVLVIVAGTIAAAWRARGTYAAALMAAPALAFVLVNLVDWSWHLAGSGAVWAVALGALLGWEGEGEG
jgi:O-antigen ligase